MIFPSISNECVAPILAFVNRARVFFKVEDSEPFGYAFGAEYFGPPSSRVPFLVACDVLCMRLHGLVAFGALYGHLLIILSLRFPVAFCRVAPDIFRVVFLLFCDVLCTSACTALSHLAHFMAISLHWFRRVLLSHFPRARAFFVGCHSRLPCGVAEGAHNIASSVRVVEGLSRVIFPSISNECVAPILAFVNRARVFFQVVDSDPFCHAFGA